MNILEQIFKLENPKLDNKIPNEIYDLLFDWFSESNISIAKFESEFFEPIVKAFRTLENENKYFENNYEQVRRGYYLKFAFLYLMYHNPNNEFLKRFFASNDNTSLKSTVTHWHSHAGLAQKDPDLFRPLTIGSQIARYYHAIHARIDQNLSYLPGSIAQLKFENDPAYFNTVFNYLNAQAFEEKPYMMFLLSVSTATKYNYEKDENGKRIKDTEEIVSVSPYDDLVDAAFEKSIQEHNQIYKANLNKEMFLILNDFLTYQKIDKKAKLSIDTFKQAKDLISAVKGNELLMLEHIIYYLKYEHLYEQDRYWVLLLTALTKGLVCPTDWLENKIDFLLSKGEERSSVLKNEIRNAHLIFNCIVTPLLQNSSSQLTYRDRIVQQYETLYFNRIKIAPFPQGLSILRAIANNSVGNVQERAFLLSKLSEFYFTTNNFDFSTLVHDVKDKSFTTIKSFIENLNTLVPVALKKVTKQTYYNEDNETEEKIFVINHAGKDIGISRSNLIGDINELLTANASAYRLVAIPLILKAPDWHKHRYLLYALAFMNKNEYVFFNQNYLIEQNMVKWYSRTFHDTFEWFKSKLETSENLHPVFTVETDVPFEEFKKAQLNSAQESAGDNIFLSDINWEWFKDKYIDELSSKEQWYEIMHVICQCPKGKKAPAAWLAELRKAIEKLGTEKYFKELQVLISLSIKEESWFFDTYANALKGLIWSCAYISPNDLSLSILKTIAEHSYTKIYGIGAKSTATGNLVLEALVGTQKEEAFGILNIMRNKTKYNKFAVALEKSIDKFKETSTIPEQLLADKSIPDFGFDNGERIFEIGDYTLIASIEKKKLVKRFEDKEGNTLKKAPSDLSEELSKELKEINEEIKQVNSVFTDLSKRIKTYWLYDRVWKYSDWHTYINGNALIYPHVETLIWTNKTLKKDFILIDHQLLDADNKPVVSNPEDEISLWHPVANDQENISKWQNYLWSNTIVQNERQAFRESYPFSSTELELVETPRFAHHFLETHKLMAIANNTGWIFTYVHEGVNWPRMYLKPFNITVHLTCDYDRFSAAIPTKQLYFTLDNSTKINDYKPKQTFEKIKLSDIPVVTLSEICRDIDLFIATTSIANNVELSENKQQYQDYRTEYHQGLFSDNANAKIRKQIIEKLAPVLKLNIQKFEGNFVIINGKSEDYKINLNSGFAQANETQKHINLIPDIKKLKSDKKLRLPIEDDETLYIILAKILYLQSV